MYASRFRRLSSLESSHVCGREDESKPGLSDHSAACTVKSSCLMTASNAVLPGHERLSVCVSSCFSRTASTSFSTASTSFSCCRLCSSCSCSTCCSTCSSCCCGVKKINDERWLISTRKTFYKHKSQLTGCCCCCCCCCCCLCSCCCGVKKRNDERWLISTRKTFYKHKSQLTCVFGPSVYVPLSTSDSNS